MDEDQIVEMIGRVTKSVVNINTLMVFHDIFYRTVPVRGMGSGLILDDKGDILTNSHVIEQAEKIAVTLADGRIFKGKLVGTCRSTDSAIIKIDAKNLTVAELGDSSGLKVGQRVFAIGNPFGLAGGPTVTSGVISALNRTINSEEGSFTNLIQTDAAINPGNSGGPLIDTQGKAIAINTAIIPFAQGIGFAIPINEAKECTSDIMTHGARRGAWLGVSGFGINKDLAEHYELPVESGVIVTSVEPRGPAEKAGIERGDIIIELDGRKVAGIQDLQDVLKASKPSTKIQLTIMRGKKRSRLTAVLERTP